VHVDSAPPERFRYSTKTYRVEVEDQSGGVVTLKLAFGEPAENPRIVIDAIDAVSALNLEGGKGVKLDGPCTVPVAVAIGHAVGHLFGFVAFLDPKLNQFVVCVSHDPNVRPGDLIPKQPRR
jgi:CRISPR-associated protein Csx3